MKRGLCLINLASEAPTGDLLRALMNASCCLSAHSLEEAGTWGMSTIFRYEVDVMGE